MPFPPPPPTNNWGGVGNLEKAKLSSFFGFIPFWNFPEQKYGFSYSQSLKLPVKKDFVIILACGWQLGNYYVARLHHIRVF